MKRKNLWIKISACIMTAFLATASVAPVSAADAAAFTEGVFSDTAAEDEFGSEAVTAADSEFTDEVVAVDEAVEVLAAQAGFGTANTELKAGTYKVTVSLKNASDPSKDSMAGSCIAGAATMVIASDGNVKITVPLTSVSVGPMTAFASDWQVYKGSVGTEKTAAEYTTDESGNINSITFAVPDKSADGVYINMSTMMHSNDAFMKIEYATAELTSAPAEEPEKQKAPTIKVKTTAKNYKYATLKKKAQVFTLGATVNSKGTLSYKKLSGNSAITVNSKTGKVTVKKGVKKGTYTAKIKVSAAAKGNYKAESKTVTVTVKVK